MVALEPISREGFEGIAACLLGGNEATNVTVAVVAAAFTISMEIAFVALVRRLPADVAVLFSANNLVDAFIGCCAVVLGVVKYRSRWNLKSVGSSHHRG